MKTRLILACTMVAISLCLFACSPAPKQVSVEIFCDEFYENHHARNEVQVSVGDTITVDLCSNPTTGFLWSETAAISDQAVLQQTGHEFIAPGDRDEPPPPGTPGQEVWAFKALKKGESTISMEYSRPWEGGEKAEWTFVLNVVVE